MKQILNSLLFVLVLTGCRIHPETESYKAQYLYQKNHRPPLSNFTDSDCNLIVLVNARHLDYSDGRALLRTLAKHPSDGSKNGDVGHAWIYLQGLKEGKMIIVEGGHSGEIGTSQPRYLEGIMNHIEYGYSNPTLFERQHPRHEPNPVKYLWETRKDGFFQKGSGGHFPTYAIKLNLTPKQFDEILDLIDLENYNYKQYSLRKHQCCTFVVQVARLANLELDHTITIPLPQNLQIRGETFPLWDDPYYSELSLSSPDVLEKSMMLAVAQGKAEYALPWYLRKIRKKRCPRCVWKIYREKISNFPWRYQRALLFR